MTLELKGYCKMWNILTGLCPEGSGRAEPRRRTMLPTGQAEGFLSIIQKKTGARKSEMQGTFSARQAVRLGNLP